MRIAVIGAGISGLVSAYLLSRQNEVTVFEAAPRLGGHTHTHELQTGEGHFAVDSGFIVYNERNYPGLVKLFQELGVATQPSSMSFSVQSERTGLEWNGTDLNRLFAQRSNLVRPSFWRMIRDVLRFNREAPRLLEGGDPGWTLGEFLERQGYSAMFVENYVVPMGAAIWSTRPTEILRFPVRGFVQFFHNHGMLTIDDRPEWRVVKDGSQRYVEKLVKPFEERIRLSAPVRQVRRDEGGVTLHTDAAGDERFDRVVIAVHSDQALRMLSDATAAEREILAAIPYQPNETVLHDDRRLLPKRKRAWAAWNYFVSKEARASVAVTYDMNILQSLTSKEPFCVTLNRTDEIDPKRIFETMHYEHPQFTLSGFGAQARRSEISGRNRTHYCGAYWGWGFHEDGLQSGVAVAKELGVDWDGAGELRTGAAAERPPSLAGARS